MGDSMSEFGQPHIVWYAIIPELSQIREYIAILKVFSNYYKGSQNMFIKTSKIAIEQQISLNVAKILGKTKEKLHIEQPFMCDYGYNIEIGDNFYANHNLLILDANKVKFGDNVFIGPNCGFYTSSHPLDYTIRNKGLEYANPIIVGDNVWFGGNVVVLPGVKIGDNTVIGAGSVVTKDIPSGVVAVGNPCRVIKNITISD